MEIKCPSCGSTHVVRFGSIPTRHGIKRRYRCQECGRTFYAEGGRGEVKNECK
jgi:predicted Zn finger-like uncharacterized protein